MILDSLRIENLFCYEGAHEFELTPPGDGRAVVLFAGRNNQGKTSFLNTLKLLFLGVDNEELRSSAVANRKLARKYYVFGTDDPERTWEGMLNRNALFDRDWDKKWFRVVAQWRDLNFRIRVERRWDVRSIDRMDFDEEVQVLLLHDKGETELVGEEAEDFLKRTIDPEFLSFFMFDGELVQQMASSDDRDRIDAMERILGLTPLSLLSQYAMDAQRQWTNESASASERQELDRLQSELSQHGDQVEACDQELEDIDFEVERLNKAIAELDAGLSALKPPQERIDEGRVRERLDNKRRRLEELRLTEIPDAVLVSAPLLFNQGLVRRTLEHLTVLQAAAKDTNRSSDLLLGSLLDEVPRAFDRPPFSNPPLTESQKNHYKKVLKRLLHSYQSIPDESGDQMPPDAQNRARTALARARDDDRARQKAVRLLGEAMDLQTEVESLGTQLDRALDLPEVDQEERARLQAKRDELVEKRGAQREQRKQVKQNKQAAIHRKDELKQEIRQQEDRVKLAEAARVKVKTARAVVRFVDALSDTVRKRARKRLEEAINTHFHELFSSNTQIARITVAENLGLSYRTADDQSVGKGNISAGTKQLVAISFLWALKELAGSELPVVVDTPLARLDLEHQENLLRRYFPHASRQVILLATDSELTPAKYGMLKPAIYREFALVNPAGGAVQVTQDEPMYDLTEEA